MDGYVHLHQVLFQCQGEHSADLDGVLATNSELANVLPGNAATWAHLEVRTQKSKKIFSLEWWLMAQLSRELEQSGTFSRYTVLRWKEESKSEKGRGRNSNQIEGHLIGTWDSYKVEGWKGEEGGRKGNVRTQHNNNNPGTRRVGMKGGKRVLSLITKLLLQIYYTFSWIYSIRIYPYMFPCSRLRRAPCCWWEGRPGL